MDVGLDENDARAALERVLSDKSQREEVERELCELFKDRSVLLVELLDNDCYVVYPAEDEADAKAYIVEILWDRVFPTAPVP